MTVQADSRGPSSMAAGDDASDDKARAQQVAVRRRRRQFLLNIAIRAVSVTIVLLLWEQLGDHVDAARLGRRDGALPVERAPERVDDAPDERVAHRHLGDAPGGPDLVTLLDLGVVAQDDRAHGVLFEVEGEPEDAPAEVEELRRHASREAVDAGDAVTDLYDRAHVDRLGLAAEALDLGLDDLGDL